ncbi:hypothetical protein GC176_18065 [bacterium]|nr:hypothetical protein [bacterium]
MAPSTSAFSIAEMTDRELAHFILSAEPGFLRPDVRQRLEGYDRPTLTRLAFLTLRAVEGSCSIISPSI